MPFMKKSARLAICILLGMQPALTMAQTQAKNVPGYLVTTKGDTLRGFLTVPQFITESGLRYRATEKSASQTFTPQDVRAFGLQDGRRFVRRTLPIRLDAQTGVVDSAAVFLQQLLAGATDFYRYEASRRASTSEARQAGNVKLYVSKSSYNLVQLRRVTHQSVLSALFKDCPVVLESLPRTPFEEYKLGDLVLRYNTDCQTSTPAHDYRLPREHSSLQVFVSLHAGLQQGKLFYTSSSYFAKANAQPTTLPVYALELRLANKGPWSLITGAHYANLQSEATQVQPAQAGTTNAGELLSLPFTVDVKSLQAPVLVRYTLGHKPFRPYLAAGALLGMYTRNQTKISYNTLTRIGSSTSTPYRNDVVTESVHDSEAKALTVSGAIRLGLQFKVMSHFSPLLEAQYSVGGDSESNPGLKINASTTQNIGRLRYQALSLLVGVEF